MKRFYNKIKYTEILIDKYSYQKYDAYIQLPISMLVHTSPWQLWH